LIVLGRPSFAVKAKENVFTGIGRAATSSIRKCV
jgi:hypothetical protein